jgi:uncharacterized protein YjbJ (UPF0337 family)
MSIAEKISQTAEAIKGSVKEMIGRVTGSRRRRTEGRGEGQGRLRALTARGGNGPRSGP